MVRVESAADHPELVETVARWHWEEWGDADLGGSLETWTTNLRSRTNRTSAARPFYERLGWTVLGEDFYEGEPVAIMELRL